MKALTLRSCVLLYRALFKS